jgi:hypothetical protein
MNASLRRIILSALFLSIAFPLLHSQVHRQVPFEAALSCTTTSVGRIPISDLGSGSYQGYQGGLYSAGSNRPPASHLSGGLVMAAQVVPRSSSGNIDLVNGRIVLLSIGMSNATQEFSTFMPLANADSSKNPKLTIVDGAQGGQTAGIISNPTSNFWTLVDQRLTTAGVTRQQVQVAWVKEANAGPTEGFPRHASILDSEFVLIARILKSRYPNIMLAYWSSRTYGGYATTTLNPEPYAYESGFAVKWTITRQVNGDTALTYTGTNPRSPWLAWGPYLWADGIIPRSDGLVWICDDFVTTDRTHPSTSGRLKVATMLLNFFKTDTTTKGWFTRAGSTSTDPNLETQIPNRFSLEQNYPNPFNPSTTISFIIPASPARSAEAGARRAGGPHSSFAILKVFDVLGREVATLVNEPILAGTHQATFDGSRLASGTYFFRLQAGTFMQTRRLLLLR